MAKRYIADTFEGVATTVVDDAITNAKLSNMAVNTIKGRITAGTGDPEDLTATQVRTIINVADGANNYVHPTGDGNLHVPATGTTNNGKVLKAGATAGSLVWADDNNTIYTHPATHPPSIITQDINNRFVTDTEKGVWNGKQNALNGTGFVKASGTTISYDNTSYLHTGNFIAGTHYQAPITNPITGTLTTNRIPKASGTGSLTDSVISEVDGNVQIQGGLSIHGGNILIGTTSDNGAKLQVNGSGFFSGALATDGVIGTKNEYAILRKDTYAQAGSLFSAAGNITFDMFNVGAVLNFTAGTGTATFASTVTATSFIKSGGTSTQYLMADGSVSSSTALPYKVYTALMQQSGTAAPTATIMQNTLGATITWSRFGTGQYIGTASSGVLTIGKTTVIVTRPNPSATAFDTNVAGNPINTTTFAYSTFNNTAYLDDQSFSVFVEIRVYP